MTPSHKPWSLKKNSTSLLRIIIPTTLIRSPPPAPSPFRDAPGLLLRRSLTRGYRHRSAHRARAAGTLVRIFTPPQTRMMRSHHKGRRLSMAVLKR